MVACFFCKTGHVATVPIEHRRTLNSEWCTTICLPYVFGEIWKTNKKRPISMAIRALTHRLKSAPYWLAKTSNWWVMRRTALTGFTLSRKNCVVNDFRNQKILLVGFKAMFWWCPNRSGKTNTNTARILKYYAKK